MFQRLLDSGVYLDKQRNHHHSRDAEGEVEVEDPWVTGESAISQLRLFREIWDIVSEVCLRTRQNHETGQNRKGISPPTPTSPIEFLNERPTNYGTDDRSCIETSVK